MAAMRILRVEEELMVHAVARAQNGNVIEGIMFDWEFDGSRDAVQHDPSDDTMSNTVSAEEAGKATITVTAVDQHVSADLNIEVTAKAGKVTLMAMGEDDAFEPKDSYFPNDPIAAKLEAIPDVKHRAGSDVKWTGSGSVKVEVLKDNNPNKRYAKITAKSAGTGTVTAMYEGKEASFDVVVSGPRVNTRTIEYFVSGTTFTGTKGDESSGFSPADITLEAVLEDDEGDPLSAKELTATIGGTAGSLVPTITSPSPSHTGADGTITFTIVAPTETSDFGNAGQTHHTITLKSLGARDVEVRITVDVKPDPADGS